MAYDPNNRMSMMPAETDGGRPMDPRLADALARMRSAGPGYGMPQPMPSFPFGGFGGGFGVGPRNGALPGVGGVGGVQPGAWGRIEKGAWNDPNRWGGGIPGGGAGPMRDPRLPGGGGGPQYWSPPGGGRYNSPTGPIPIGPGGGIGRPGWRPGLPMPPAGGPSMAKPAMVNPRQKPGPVNGQPMGMFKQPLQNTVGNILGGVKPRPATGGTSGSWF